SALDFNTVGAGTGIITKGLAMMVAEDRASGKIAAYVTDFPTEETVGVDGIVAIPHLGASTAESEDNCAVMAAEELVEYLERGNIRNSVNFPAVSIPHNGAARICVLHKNIPNVLTCLTGCVSEKGINIANLSNGSKGEYAYTILELDSAVPAGTAEAMQAIDGVIRVRVL
ncbi:MAG: 3-phosphoglycerate dehydrogenase, partial [Clostridia bacterium]|nr:3-phosphoglycerate dehydrogenase [Clostridia bacterium]